MPYIGNQHNVGDHVNNFKVLDDISSYTATFDGSATSVVSAADDTIRIPEHRFIQGQRVTYTNGGGGNIGGLTTGTAYFVSFDTANTIKLATTLANANNNTVINLSAVGSGTSHTLNAAFDGVNTKFKMTHGSGKSARLNNATQLNVAINNVIQRPNLDPNNFTDGFAIQDNHKIVFKTAPTVNDVFWGSIIANTIENFDLSDNEIDNFTGDGSTTEFTLSTIPANNESVIVSINGVVQHPSDKNTARSYTLIDSIIQFTAAPALGDGIQVRHIGFAGATTADVSGFYGRTGNVTLTSNDNITTGDIASRNINSSGIITATTFSGGFSGNVVGTSATFTGNLNVGGVLTYEDVTNVDSVGIITAQKDVHVGAGLSVVGVTTATGAMNVNNILTVTRSGSNTAAVFSGGGGAGTINIQDGDDGTLAMISVDGGNLKLKTSGGSYSDKLVINPAGNVSIAKDLDVDGHTNLDNVSIAGLTTFSGNVNITNTNPKLFFYDTNNDSDYAIVNNGGVFRINDETNSLNRFSIDSNGNVSILKDLDVDGHTELDNVRISGITTVSGEIRKPLGSYHPMLTIRNQSGGSVAMRIDNWSNSASTKRMSITHNFNRISSAFAADDSSIGCASVAFEDGEIRFGTSAAGTNNSSTRFYINSSGHFIPNADSTYDIGTNSVRVRNFYADTLYGDGSNLTGITQTTINSNTNNYLITGTGTANTLQGEANLTFTGQTLTAHMTTADPAVFVGDSNRTGAGQHLAEYRGYWDGNHIGRIVFAAGDDTTNKDDGIIKFHTTPSGGGITERLRILSNGKVVVGDTNSDAQFGVYRASYNIAEFTNTNADATGAEVALRKDSSSPADGDTLGILKFIGDNDTGEKVNYAYIQSKSSDVSDGTEDGRLEFYTRGAGTLGERLRIDSGGSVSIGDAATHTYSAHSEGDDLVIGGSGWRGMTIYGEGGGGVIQFADNASNRVGQILYNHSDNMMMFRTAGNVDRLTISGSGMVQIGGAVANSADLDTTNTRLTIKQSANNKEDGIYLERSGERRGHYIYVGGALGQSDALCFSTNQLGTDTDILALDRSGNIITGTGNIGVAGATGTDFSLLDGMVINTGNGSAGLLINSSSSSHNAYLGFSYGSGSSTSHADQYSAYIGRVGDNTLILGTNNNIRATLNPDGEFGVGVSPLRKLHVKSGSNSNDGAFRVESAPNNIMDMGTDGSMHFLNCVNNDPFRIKFAGNEAIRITQETSGNWTTSLQFYMETSQGQGAAPYIKGVAGTEAGSTDNNNAGGFEFHSRTGGSGTDVNAMRINANGRVAIGAHNVQNPTAALHIIGDTSGSNTALQVGQDSGARYFRVNEVNGQSNFLECLLSYYDNTLAHVLKLQNTFAGAPNFGTAIQFIGHGGTQTGRIAVKNRDANSASNSIMELQASYITKPSHPCFDANRTNGAVSSTNVIVYDSASLNNGNHYDTSNGRFTAPVDGMYQFWFGAIKQDTTGVVRLHMRKNGASTNNVANARQLRLDSHDSNGKYGENGAVTLITELTKDDYVQVYVTAGTVYGSGVDYTYFCGTLVG